MADIESLVHQVRAGDLAAYGKLVEADPWAFMGETLHVVADLLPGRNTMIEPVEFAGCSRAWEIGIDVEGKWVVVLSWGIYSF